MARILLDTNTGLLGELTRKIAVLQKQVDSGKSGKQLQKAINKIVNIKNLITINLSRQDEIIDPDLKDLKVKTRRQDRL